MEFEALKNAITRILQVYPGEIQEDSTFAGDLGADSLDMLQIFKLVEEDLDISLKETDFDKIITVEDALTYIKECS